MKATKNKRSALRRRKKRLTLIAVIGIILSLMIVAGGTSAYLQKNTGAVNNTFTAAAAPTPVIIEDFDGEVKENVQIKLSNDGSGTYYVRAAVVFSLQDSEGNTVAKVPVSGTDYTISYSEIGWSCNPGDGYWYCRTPIAPGESTPVLINSCTSLNEEYSLVVDILAQTVQAIPGSVATDVWGYTPAPGGN